MSSLTNLLETINIHGHMMLDGTHLIDLIDISKIEFGKSNGSSGENLPISNLEVVNHALSIIHHEIAREFIEPCTNNYEVVKTRQIWESSPEHHKVWHNDSTEKSNDMFFLLYFTDQRSTNEGALIIKNRTGEYRYVPHPGLLIAMENSSTEWIHMVESSKTKRVVASLSFKINQKK